MSVDGDGTGVNWGSRMCGGAISLLSLMGMILKRTSGRKEYMGISDVLQVVTNVREVCGGRTAAKNFNCVVGDSMPGSGGGGSDAK